MNIEKSDFNPKLALPPWIVKIKWNPRVTERDCRFSWKSQYFSLVKDALGIDRVLCFLAAPRLWPACFSLKKWVLVENACFWFCNLFSRWIFIFLQFFIVCLMQKRWVQLLNGFCEGWLSNEERMFFGVQPVAPMFSQVVFSAKK